MYMNGRGPMNRGFSPVHRPMGCRPMGMHHDPVGIFPFGGLLILPALMFGGWIAIAVVGWILSLIGSIIGGIFSGLSSLASGAFSGSGVVIGIVIGLALFFWFRNRNAKAASEDEEEE